MANHQAKIQKNNFSNTLRNLTIFPQSPRIAVAVSGGADSLCLTFLLKEFVAECNGSLIALIVDHGLRAESKQEAKNVSDLLNAHHINNIVLERQQTNQASALQEKAREDRYNLLSEYCRVHYIPYLLVAHHMNDQLETMLIREDKGLNIIGNTGMSAKVVTEAVIILRPLLQYTKQQVIETVKQFTPSWIEDPSNNNNKYTRVQKRQELGLLTEEAINTLKEKLYEHYSNRISLESQVVDLLADIFINRLGLIKINLRLFYNYSAVVQQLALRSILQYVSGKKYFVNIKKIKNLLRDIAGVNKVKLSLSNCILHKTEDYVVVYRARQNLPQDILISSKDSMWDNRFLLIENNDRDKCDYYISRLSDSEYGQLAKDKNFKKYFCNYGLNGETIQSIPWLFLGEEPRKQLSWDGTDYLYFQYKARNSLYMNEFYNLGRL